MMALAVLTQPYPARVKEQFWFRELRQAVAVLAEGKSFADLKRMSEEENFFNASSASRANEIRQVLERRLKAAGPSFVPFSAVSFGDAEALGPVPAAVDGPYLLSLHG